MIGPILISAAPTRQYRSDLTIKPAVGLVDDQRQKGGAFVVVVAVVVTRPIHHAPAAASVHLVPRSIRLFYVHETSRPTKRGDALIILLFTRFVFVITIITMITGKNLG